MLRNFSSAIYLISGILIALGGLGHSFGAVAQIREAFAGSGLDPRIVRLVLAVWHFAGAAMVALGVLMVLGWNRARSEGRLAMTVPVVISLFYVGYGICALAWMREPFWAIFVVYGAMAIGSAIGMNRAGSSSKKSAA